MSEGIAATRDEANASKVKALTWKVSDVSSYWTGEILFQTYYIIIDEGSGWRVFRGQSLSEFDDTEIAFSASVDIAKGAAQEDFSHALSEWIEDKGRTSAEGSEP